MRRTKGKHAFIVATHIDRSHIHNHIIYNSTSLDGTRKFKNFFLSGLVVQRLSDMVCIEHGLSVIEPKVQFFNDPTVRKYYSERTENRMQFINYVLSLCENKETVSLNEDDFNHLTQYKAKHDN